MKTRHILLLAPASVLAGCSYFSQTVDPGTHDRIHEAIRIGMSSDEAEARLSSFNFSCSQRTGEFTAENGSDHTAARFLQCVTRPGNISFKCENRDQVFVVTKGDVVDDVEVVRGPNCGP